MNNSNLTETTETKFLTITEAAVQMRCGEMTLRRAITSGRLQVSRAGRLIRIDQKDLDAYANRVNCNGW